MNAGCGLAVTFFGHVLPGEFLGSVVVVVKPTSTMVVWFGFKPSDVSVGLPPKADRWQRCATVLHRPPECAAITWRQVIPQRLESDFIHRGPFGSAGSAKRC